jgi:hypothetical protein
MRDVTKEDVVYVARLGNSVIDFRPSPRGFREEDVKSQKVIEGPVADPSWVPESWEDVAYQMLDAAPDEPSEFLFQINRPVPGACVADPAGRVYLHGVYI